MISTDCPAFPLYQSADSAAGHHVKQALAR
jgi:hypothetical protein